MYDVKLFIFVNGVSFRLDFETFPFTVMHVLASFNVENLRCTFNVNLSQIHTDVLYEVVR